MRRDRLRVLIIRIYRMNQSIYRSIVACIIAMIAIPAIGNTSTLHYWNFNSNASVPTLLIPSVSLINGASIQFTPGASSIIDAVGGTGQNFSVLNLNARNGDVSGTHLRVNNPLGSELLFNIPTIGYKDIRVSFSTRRSGSGAGIQYWAYSLDGVNFIGIDTLIVLDADPVLRQIDLSLISALDNNPNAKIRVQFAQGAGSTTGNNRFDNIAIDGKIIPPSTLLHYWNFNNNATIAAISQPTQSIIANASLTHIAGGTSFIDPVGGTSQNFSVLNSNARNGDVSGTHLRFNNPIGGELVFALPTTGFEDVSVTFTTRRSGSGAGTQIWSYSVDGTNYVAKDTIIVADADPVLRTLSCVGVTGVDNNPNFKFKVSFLMGAGGISGNNRFDNFTLDGLSLLGIDTTAPTAVFKPTNGSKYIAQNIQPTITFSEQIRRADNSALNPVNILSAIEVRVNDSLGASIPFAASYAASTITIIPSSPLEIGQRYYIGIIPNALEDNSDNPIRSRLSTAFTVIPPQTIFQPGDVIPIAYRMNALSTDDEIALLTLIDIIPETIVQLTDSKVIDGSPSQCQGGITWISPLNECLSAGSVITIKTEALTANKGTVSGAGFGLSSSGDQVIIYTGIPSNPQYITALSSNAWAGTNISCSGSLSLIPPGLVDGSSAVSLANAPGSVSGNSVNAFYNGIQQGGPSILKSAILNSANWIVTGAGTPQQVWPSYLFQGPPRVSTISVIGSTSLRIVYSTNMDSLSVIDQNNYVGLVGIQSISMTSNGSLPDTAIITMSFPFVNNQFYSLTIQQVRNAFGQTMVCPYFFSFNYRTTVSFGSPFLSVSEGAGIVNIPITVSNPAQGSFAFDLMPAPFSTTDAQDFGIFDRVVNITPTTTSFTLSVPIVQDTVKEQHTEYATFRISGVQNCALSGDSTINVFLRDDDRLAPKASESLSLRFVTSYEPSRTRTNSCEVIAYDPLSERLFTTSGIEGFVDVTDFSEPSSPKLIRSINMNQYGSITSLAVHNGLLVVASPNAMPQLPGSVIAMSLDGVPIKQFTVGVQPDMITFTPDGNKILVANEGQPNLDYSIDPEGSVTIIDISKGIQNTVQSDVKTLDFTAFNSQASSLIAQGIRKTRASSTLSQDIEPEYITVDENSQRAWVTLQENNAIAEVNLINQSIVSIFPLGTKDYSKQGNGIDASDNNQVIAIANWPVKAFYIPDAIANYSVNGNRYLITANEGDEKEYTTLNERTTVGASSYVLDSVRYPHRNQLKKNHMLGRFRVTNLNGDANGDGVFEDIYCVGSRSFSIIDASSKNMIYDSGDDFEMITSTLSFISPIFNADNENNTLKGRSRSKGPEPEGVVLAEIDGRTYAFTTLERVGGIMAYDITNPNDVSFVDYANSRSTTTISGDRGPETIIYIPPSKHRRNRSYLAVANEISGTISIFEIVNNRNRPLSKDWGNGDADGSSLPGKKHAGLPQQRYITHSDARLIMRWTVNDKTIIDSFKSDSTEFSNLYRADVNHNGRYYFSNRTPDNQNDTTIWKRFIDLGVDGQRLRYDSSNYLAIMPPDAGPLSRVYFQTTPMDAALILHYLAGRVPTLPWIWDTIPSYGKVVKSGPPVSIREIQRNEQNNFSMYALFPSQDKTQALSISLNSNKGIALLPGASGLNNSEYAFDESSIHYAGSEQFNSNVPIMTFTIPGSTLKTVPIIINDVYHTIDVDQSISSVDETKTNSVTIIQNTAGLEVTCQTLGGIIRIHNNVGKLVFSQDVNQHIVIIPNDLFESGLYHFIHSKGNTIQTETFVMVR